MTRRRGTASYIFSKFRRRSEFSSKLRKVQNKVFHRLKGIRFGLCRFRVSKRVPRKSYSWPLPNATAFLSVPSQRGSLNNKTAFKDRSNRARYKNIEEDLRGRPNRENQVYSLPRDRYCICYHRHINFQSPSLVQISTTRLLTDAIPSPG